MTPVARLDCPLCGAVAFDGPVPQRGTCLGCGASYCGGRDTPPEACTIALAELGFAGDGPHLARELFTNDTAAHGVAIASDQREGFYAWWLVVADTDAARTLLADLAGGSPVAAA